MQKDECPLDLSKIVSAFEIIIDPHASKDLIRDADHYIQDCESNPQFSLALMAVFDKAAAPQKWQILIHLNNVIKRNWTTKRRVRELPLDTDTKQKIKDGLMGLYKVHWEGYYKQFNQIFSFLAKHEFPAHYPALENFILQILSSLANSDIQMLIAPKELLPYLSLVKAVYKQNSRPQFQRRETEIQHIAQPIKLSYQILLKINQAFEMIKGLPSENVNHPISNKLLECSRKIDKIILYCLQSSGSSIQADRNIREIVLSLVMKIQLLLSIRSAPLNQQVELNIFALLQGLSKLMVMLPFIYTGFLEKYLQVILNLLINQTFENQDLLNCIITANTKPLITVSYYLSEAKYRESVECIKSSKSVYWAEQAQCHLTFMAIYGGSNAIAFMEKAVMELMTKYYVKSQDKQLIFQDSENQGGSPEYSCFQLLLILLKHLMSRFKDEFKPFVCKILDYLIQNNLPSTASPMALHLYEIAILMPKVYDEANMKVDKIFQLVQICWAHHDFTTLCRLIRHFNAYFNLTQTSTSFQLLAGIIASSDVNHQTLFQSAVCIKKILSQHDQEGLPVDKLGPCLANLLKLIAIYKGVPSHLWNLLQLANDILKVANSETILSNFQASIQYLNGLVESEDNDQTVVAAISDILLNLFEVLFPEVPKDGPLLQKLRQISIFFISKNICNLKIEDTRFLYKLWIAVARSVEPNCCPLDFADKLLNALQSMKPKTMEKDPALFLELAEQYFLAGLLKLSSQNILQLCEQIVPALAEAKRPRILMALFSLYFTFFLSTRTIIQKLLVFATTEVCQLQSRLSPSINNYRTFLILIINHHILELGPENVFATINKAYDNGFMGWLPSYLWSLEYLGYKYACKLSSMALLASLDALENSHILNIEFDGFIPLDKIIKAISFQVQPVNMVNAITSYISFFKMVMEPESPVSRPRITRFHNNAPRKFKLHIIKDWAQCDLSKLFVEKFMALFSRIGWTTETISSRFDQMTSTRIMNILTLSNSQDAN